MDKDNIRVRRSDNYDSELFHSDRFLGDEFSDDLYHFKYIKREKGKNGKWRYYYDKEQLKDDLGFDERDAANKQHDYVMTIGAAREVERQKYKDMLPSFGPANPQRQKMIDEQRDSLDEWDKKYSEEAKKYYEKQKEFHKTPLGKLDKAKEAGKNVIEKVLKKDIWKDFQKSKR